MKPLSINQILTATKGTLICGSSEGVISGVSTDSRTVEKGHLFCALIGDKFDGHDFIDVAAKKGCEAFIISNKNGSINSDGLTFILVDDTLTAYQDIAAYYKNLIKPITIGVTGSVGKTSLKDMLNIIASDHFNTVCSRGNENNHIGVPRTILRLEENTEVLILEMGMNHKGEIERLVQIGRPDIAGITNVGVSHLENFDGEDGIFNAKMEITHYFSKENTLVVNGEDQWLKKVKDNDEYNVLSVGESRENDYVVSEVKYLDDTHMTFLIEYDNGVERFTLPVAGLYNSITAALATAIMSRLNVSVANCAHSLQKLEITPHRLQLINKHGVKIIDDTYNASPDSMKSGIEYLKAIGTKRKIAVLADMKELGKSSSSLHRGIGEYVGDNQIDYLFTVGELAREIGKGALASMESDRIFSYMDKNDCIDAINKIKKEGDGILVKGSNSMKMTEIVERL